MSFPLNPRPRHRRRALAAAAAGLVLALQVQVAAAQQARFDIAAQPLATALDQFARQAGLQLVFASSLAQGRTAPALYGTQDVRQALDTLLRGSGLSGRVRGGTLTVVRVSSEQHTLAEVTVAASSLGETTQGSGSYTTGAARSATGLALSLRDTPQSVSVITQERIADQQMATVADALRASTGVSVKAVDRGRNELSVRGFTVSNFQIDGLPVVTGNVGVETASTVIYDRVEVVRGATGLLGGAGDPAATVNLVRKHAESKVLAGAATVQLGSWGRRTATVDLSTPFNADASVRGRIAASAGQADAYIDLERTRNTTLYGVIDADLDASTRVSVGASTERNRRRGVYWGGLPVWYGDGTRADWSRSTTTATPWNRWDTDEHTLFATLERRIANDWTVRANLNHYRQKEVSNLLWVMGAPDRATGAGMTAYPYLYITEPRQTQVNLQASGPFRLGGREHEAMVGLIHGRATSGWDNGNVPLNEAESAGPIGNFFTWGNRFPEPVWGTPDLASRDTTTQTAVYAAGQLQLTDSLKAVVGGRVTRWRQTNGQGTWTAQAYDLGESGVFTPYAGLLYDLTPELTAYASYTTIFKPQSARDRHGSYLDPLEGKSYEAGLKGEFLGGRLNASGAVFRIQQDNFAVEDVGHVIPGTGSPAMRASDGVKAQGYELELAGKIAPDWDLSASWVSYSARDAQRVDVAQNHPRRVFKVFTKYTLPGDWRRLAIGGGVEWQGDVPKLDTNPATGAMERIGQRAFALVGLMARYQATDALALQLNVYNLFDKKYYENSWQGITYGEPRKLLVSLAYSF